MNYSDLKVMYIYIICIVRVDIKKCPIDHCSITFSVRYNSLYYVI